MKSVTFTILLLLAFAIGKAQNSITASVARSMESVAIVVDSVEVAQNSLNLIDPQSIKKIDVVRNSKYPGGVLYITLKDHSLLAKLSKEKPVSLAQITDSEITAEDKKRPRIYILDNRLVTDTSAIRIQPSQYHHIRIIPASDAPYFKTTFPNAILVIVTTTPPAAGGPIMIRGTR